MIYRVFHLKDRNSNSSVELLKTVEKIQEKLQREGHNTFGLFHGLFGLATNEIYFVLMSDDEAADPSIDIERSGLISIDTKVLVATVRPTVDAARTKPGIYVFRWFKVKNRNVDEIANLSDQAWKTFEAGFDTEVQGLFAEADRSTDDGTMLLNTWYRDLTVWEESRRPGQAARDLFMRRHKLTTEATPVATRLYLPG